MIEYSFQFIVSAGDVAVTSLILLITFSLWMGVFFYWKWSKRWKSS